jgi:hypothetical protein
VFALVALGGGQAPPGRVNLVEEEIHHLPTDFVVLLGHGPGNLLQ